jgi:hypothetical protein
VLTENLYEERLDYQERLDYISSLLLWYSFRKSFRFGNSVLNQIITEYVLAISVQKIKINGI